MAMITDDSYQWGPVMNGPVKYNPKKHQDRQALVPCISHNDISFDQIPCSRLAETGARTRKGYSVDKGNEEKKNYSY